MAEAGFTSFCKCEHFRGYSFERRRAHPHLRGVCKTCGGLRREWRCKKHGLRAVPAKQGQTEFSMGCPRCGADPHEQQHDQYMTKQAQHG
jgi:hypothetical protein